MYDSLIDRLIDLAIEEDIATGDITTNAIIPVHAKAVAEMKAKADGVISGLEIAKQVFERFEKDIVWEPLVTDGTAVKKGDIILRIEASYRTLLCGGTTCQTVVSNAKTSGSCRRKCSRQ